MLSGGGREGPITSVVGGGREGPIIPSLFSTAVIAIGGREGPMISMAAFEVTDRTNCYRVKDHSIAMVGGVGFFGLFGFLVFFVLPNPEYFCCYNFTKLGIFADRNDICC